MVDTGGSNFRFADDYVDRITRAFTGDESETVSEKQDAPLFPRSSHDGSPPLAGGGAWPAQDMQKMEAIVREEVQMVVREIVEKVVWEIVPELAENMIRKELDKVLKEIEPN
jgi:hypothetical protein